MVTQNVQPVFEETQRLDHLQEFQTTTDAVLNFRPLRDILNEGITHLRN